MEVDTSAYAIPWRDHVTKWLAVTPKGFLFHFKAFNLFTARNIAPGAIPAFVRKQLSSGQQTKKSVTLNELTVEQQYVILLCWTVLHALICCLLLSNGQARDLERIQWGVEFGV